MRNFTIYLALALCLFVTKIFAQEQLSFSERVDQIAEKIQAVKKEEKATLKLEIEEVNKELENGVITKQQADEKKVAIAEKRAAIIDQRIEEQKLALNQIIKEAVDGTLKNNKKSSYSFVWSNNDSIKRVKGEPRTTTQAVFAIGLNNLVTNGSVAHSDYRMWRSNFYEWGFTWNTRLSKESNLFHLKYGLSLMYNDLRPTENRIVVKNGDQTILTPFQGTGFEDARFRNVFLSVPLHFEFDFTKSRTNDGKRIYNSHRSIRFGVGGYAGVRVKSKQKIWFDDPNGNDVMQKTKGDFNVNDFAYGLSTFLGYREISLYLKYDLNPMFQNNAVDQRNISLGIRFDFN
jgi:hypothetical protein